MPHIHNRQCSGDHYGQPARFCDVLNLYELKNIAFNSLIVGPTNSGKTQYLVNQLRGPFWGKFDYIVFIWPTFVHNKTHDRFLDNDPYIFVVGCPQEEVEFWLKLKSYFFSGNKHAHYFGRLRCVERGHTGQLVPLGFSARHTGISFWVLTQQITSITKPFRENLAAIVLFYTPSGKTTKAIFEDYASELSSEKYKEMIAKLKKYFSHLVYAPRHPYGIKTFSINIYNWHSWTRRGTTSRQRSHANTGGHSRQLEPLRFSCFASEQRESWQCLFPRANSKRHLAPNLLMNK